MGSRPIRFLIAARLRFFMLSVSPGEISPVPHCN
jgi:hypothetical protein